MRPLWVRSCELGPRWPLLVFYERHGYARAW